MKKFLFPAAYLIPAASLALSAGLTPYALAQEERAISISYEEGQLITLAAPINRAGEEAASARVEYFQRVRPIADGLGLSQDGALAVTETLVGQFHPGALSFFSWPSAEAEGQLSAHPDWLDIKALRPIAWDALRLYSVELDQDLDLTFEEGKAYSMAVAWINPEHPESYDRYLDTLEPSLHAIGARFIYRMQGPRFESHSDTGPAPARLTLVEWQTGEDLTAFLEGDAFTAVYPDLQQGVTRFELHRIAPVFPEG